MDSFDSLLRDTLGPNESLPEISFTIPGTDGYLPGTVQWELMTAWQDVREGMIHDRHGMKTYRSDSRRYVLKVAVKPPPAEERRKAWNFLWEDAGVVQNRVILKTEVVHVEPDPGAHIVVAQPRCRRILELDLNRVRDNETFQRALKAMKEVVKVMLQGLTEEPRQLMFETNPGDWGRIGRHWYLLAGRKLKYDRPIVSPSAEPADAAGLLSSQLWTWIQVPAKRHGPRPFQHMAFAFSPSSDGRPGSPVDRA